MFSRRRIVARACVRGAPWLWAGGLLGFSHEGIYISTLVGKRAARGGHQEVSVTPSREQELFLGRQLSCSRTRARVLAAGGGRSLLAVHRWLLCRFLGWGLVSTVAVQLLLVASIAVREFEQCFWFACRGSFHRFRRKPFSKLESNMDPAVVLSSLGRYGTMQLMAILMPKRKDCPEDTTA